MNEPTTIPVMTELTPPFWKLAVQKFLEAGFPDGAIVPHEWFWQAFGVRQPQPETPLEIADRLQLLYLRGIQKLDDALCVDHQIHLRSVHGEGYRVVPPDKQSATGFGDGVDMIRKGLRHMTKRLANVNTQALTDEQKAEHADNLAKLSRLKDMNRSLRHKAPEAKQIRSA